MDVLVVAIHMAVAIFLVIIVGCILRCFFCSTLLGSSWYLTCPLGSRGPLTARRLLFDGRWPPSVAALLQLVQRWYRRLSLRRLVSVRSLSHLTSHHKNEIVMVVRRTIMLLEVPNPSPHDGRTDVFAIGIYQ